MDLQADDVTLHLEIDCSHEPVFDPDRELPVPGIVIAGDPAMPDTLVREADLARLAERSPQVESRVADGCGHLIHDSRQHRAMVRAAIEDLLARV